MIRRPLAPFGAVDVQRFHASLRPIRTPLSPDVALRSARRHREYVILCAFDLLELDGWDMRPVPIEEQGYACEAAAPVDHGIACF
jgi:hypothetical protein